MAWWTRVGLVAVGTLVPATLVACGSDFSCEDTRTCGGSTGGAAGSGTGGTGGSGVTGGTSGTGASGGTAGSGTGGLPSACKVDGDCDDKDACTGKETCSNGSCQAGTPVVCNNPDAAHCEATCKDANGAANCVVNGKDVDGDTHLDAACAQSEGAADDCDDGNKAVYPGATEVCDGVDNDCNGKDELEESSPLPLAGSTKAFAGGNGDNATDPSIVWLPSAKQYGVVWASSTAGEIMFARMGVDGSKVGTAGNQESKISSCSGLCSRPRVTAGNGGYGAVWLDSAGTGQIWFRAVGADGSVKGNPQQVSDTGAKADAPDIVATSTGWIVVWEDHRTSTFGQIFARVLNADGTQVGSSDTGILIQGGNGKPRIATNGSAFVLSYLHGTNATLNVAKTVTLSTNLATSFDQALSADPPASGAGAQFAALAPTSGGWVYAFQEYTSSGDQLGMREQVGSGSLCPTSFATAQVQVPGAVAARGDKRLVVFGNDISTSARVELARFKAGCTTPIALDLAGSDTPAWDPRGTDMAWSDNGMAVVWPDQNTGTFVLQSYVTGPNLCDQPVP
jgi:hypothetical protein